MQKETYAEKIARLQKIYENDDDDEDQNEEIDYVDEGAECGMEGA